MQTRFFTALLLLAPLACVVGTGNDETGAAGDGDGDGDGDGETPGDGDGETPGDGDGETPGETTGDGDGETPGETTGEEPRICDEGLTLCCLDGADNCDDEWAPNYYDDPPAPENQRWGCVDTEVSSWHCGGCSNVCIGDDLEDLTLKACNAGICESLSQGCVPVDGEEVTCDDVCATVGSTCDPVGCGATARTFVLGECHDGGYTGFIDIGCDMPLPAEQQPASISCCCFP